MPGLIKAGETTAARKAIEFLLVDDGGNALTGLGSTPTVRLYFSGVDTAGTGAVAEVSAANRPGLYTYTPAAGEIASAGPGLLRPTAPGAVAAEWPFLVVSYDPYAAPASVPTNFDVLSIDGSGKVPASSVDSLGAGAKTDVRAQVDGGLASYDAPTKAELDAGLAPIQAKTGNLPASPASETTLAAVKDKTDALQVDGDNHVLANVKKLHDRPVLGTGVSSDKWRGA